MLRLILKQAMKASNVALRNRIFFQREETIIMISSLSKIIAGGLLATALTACSTFEPKKVACPDVRVSQGAERAYIEGTRRGQLAYVRVNGAWTECSATKDGFNMELQLGFLMKRDISESSLAEEIPLDITFAFLDSNDNVVSRFIHSDSLFFPDYTDKSKPVLIINKKIPAGMRVVFGLGKAIDG